MLAARVATRAGKAAASARAGSLPQGSVGIPANAPFYNPNRWSPTKPLPRPANDALTYLPLNAPLWLLGAILLEVADYLIDELPQPIAAGDPRVAGYHVINSNSCSCSPPTAWGGGCAHNIVADNVFDCSVASLYIHGRPPPAPAADAFRFVEVRYFGVHPLDPAFDGWAPYQHWQRNADAQPADTPAIPSPAIVPAPVEVPYVLPMVDPLANFPGRVSVPLSPVPWHAIPLLRPSPWRSPTEQPQRGPAPAPSPGAAPGTQPGGQPAPVPVPSVQVWPRTAAAPTGHVRRPPGPNTKERKFVANPRATNPIIRGINAITEGVDALRAIWKAIGDVCKKGGHVRSRCCRSGGKVTPTQMAREIYRLSDCIDMGDVLANLAAETVQDRNFGELGKRAARGYRNNPWWDRPFGVQTGPLH